MTALPGHRWPFSLLELLFATAAFGCALGWANERLSRPTDFTIPQAIKMLDDRNQVLVDCRLDGGKAVRYWLVRERPVEHPVPTFVPYQPPPRYDRPSS
jgi:hypothetical protein